MADEVTEIKVEETAAEPVATVEPKAVKVVKLVKDGVVFELTDPVQISAFINQGYEVEG